MSSHMQNHQRNTALVIPTSGRFSAAMTFENKLTILFMFKINIRERLWPSVMFELYLRRGAVLGALILPLRSIIISSYFVRTG